MKYNLLYDLEFQSHAPHGLQTSTCLHHSRLYQCQVSYPCPQPNRSPISNKSTYSYILQTSMRLISTTALKE